MKYSRIIFSVFTSGFLSVYLGAANAYASGSAHHAEGPLPSIGEFILEKKIYWINFIIYTVVLAFVAKKVFVNAWVARRAAYIEAINSGKKMLEDSKAKLMEAQKQLSQVSSEISDLKARVQKDAEFEAERIVREASDKAEKIKNQASQSAAVEKRAAINKYQEKLVELALSRARAKVSGSINADIDSRLKDKVVGSVSGLLN